MTPESITSMDADLYMAAVEGHIEKFRDHQGSLQTLRTTNLDTVLHVHLDTSTHGDEGFIKQVVEMCPLLLHQSNAQGQTPLHIAAKTKHHGTVKFLINEAMAESQKDLESNVQDGGREAARKLLREMDVDMNTALHIAVQFGHLPMVKVLLQWEDPGFRYGANKSQETPLYIAAASHKPRVVEAILNKFGSASTYGGPHGRTALHVAAMKGCSMTTRILVEKGGNRMAVETDENGHTPLHYAAHLGYLSVVRELVKYDNYKSAAYIGDKKWEMTPLLLAARQGHVQIVREILNHCPHCIEKVDKRGWNVAHFLAARRVGICLMATNPSVRNLLYHKDALGITPRRLSKGFLTKGESPIKKLLEGVFDDNVAETRVHAPNWHLIIKFDESKMEKAVETQLVVATLIATVTFAAAITVPGGFRSESSPGHGQAGTAMLLETAAFRTFILSDAIAFASSLLALLSHFRMTLPSLQNFTQTFMRANNAIATALWALSIAFSTGTYAVFKPAPVFAIASCIIGIGIYLVNIIVNFETTIVGLFIDFSPVFVGLFLLLRRVSRVVSGGVESLICFYWCHLHDHYE